MTSTFDIIIIGGGTAGCLLASRLAQDPARRVLLLEAGPRNDPRASIRRPAEYLQLQGTDVDWGYQTQASAELSGRSIGCPRGRLLGGSSAINAMIFHTGHRDDNEGWELAAGERWSSETIAKRLAQLRREMTAQGAICRPEEISDVSKVYMAAARNASERKTVVGAPEIYDRTMQHGRRRSAADIFLKATPPNLTICTGATVRRIQIDGNRATGVIVGRSSTEETIQATGTVVLAAGAIASPQLLMLSGVGPREDLISWGIEPRIDLPAVGRHLVDHLAMPVIFSTPNRAPFPSKWSMQQLARWDYLGRGPISSNLAEAGGFFDLPETAEFSATDNPKPALPRAIQLHVTPTHYLKYPHTDAPAAMTIAVTGTQPHSRGSIRLQSGDPAEPPVIDPGYLTNPTDLEVLIAGIDIARQIANTEPLAALIGDELLPGARRSEREAIERAIRRFAMTLYHPAGTCRMGTDATLSVVDPYLYVHGIDRLAIADASVFPEIPRANPVAMVMLVADRLAKVCE